ncbi:carboxypeptidase PM20D1 [Lachnospiraceae bacterium PF1-21]|uniref:M20/M25/M40 family metallo-hydrolase n=1 Tax=Ohessyouella blattaphilus TaxID=2949333 RepID=UPI003E2FA562
MKILLFILALIVLLLLVLLVRTLLLKPDSATTATIEFISGERADTYAKKLATMVQKETISSRFDNDRTKFLEFHQVLKDLFPRTFSACEKHVFDGSLLLKWPGKSAADPVLLMSHTDVVEAGGDWTHPPFSGEIKDGIIWGRGTVDTKGSLSCIFNAVEELIAEGYVPKSDVYIASSCTEEISGDGAPATVRFLKEKNVHLRFLIDEGGMILSDPIGGVKGTYAMVGVLEKGYGDLKFIAKGKGGHASAPGKNTPIPRLAKFVARIEKKSPFTVSFHPTAKEMFRRFTPNMTFPMKFIFANMWLFEPLLKKVMPSISPTGAAMLQTTMAFTMAKGSDGLNVLPQEASVSANMRFIHHQSTDESIRLVSEIAKEYDLETNIIYKNYPVSVVDYNSEQFKLVEDVIHDIYPGVGVIPYPMTGGTDAKFYQDVCEHCIRFAPLYINNQQYGSIHGIDENIDAKALPQGVDFYKEVIQRL